MSDIIPKLGPVEDRGPTTGVVAAKRVQVLLQSTISDFRLAVRLGVVGSGVLQGCTTQLEEFDPKVAHEKQIAVRDNGVWKAV